MTRTGSRSTSTMILARYRGECRACETAVQTTVRRPATSKQTDEWVRCSCGQITVCEQSGTENHHGGTDR